MQPSILHSAIKNVYFSARHLALLFFCANLRLRGLEELQHLVLWLGQLIPKSPHHLAVTKNLVPAVLGKESLDLFPGRGRGRSFLGEGSQGPKTALLHRMSEIALNEGGHEIGEVDHVA